jgi:hypothetical protein
MQVVMKMNGALDAGLNFVVHNLPLNGGYIANQIG